VEIKNNLFLWIAFSIASLLTFFVYRYLWTIKFYWILLVFLCTVSFLFAVVIIKYERLKKLPIVIIIIGLIIGQWWIFELVFVKLTWIIKGFAP
jgi:hypothetical protein